MIRELSVRNFALINELSIEFERGFSIFTGETGAGKSILIGAISLLLGERASTELIRTGAQESEVIGTFLFDAVPKPLFEILTRLEIPADDATLIIRRIISRTDKSRILINQVPVPLSTLKTIGDFLVDLHGQHEHQSLLKPETAGDIIDSLPEVNPLWREYCSEYAEFAKARADLELFDGEAAALAQKRDLIDFQYNEIAQLSLKPQEEKKLGEEYTLLSSVTERLGCVSSISILIEGSENSESLERQIVQIRKQLESLQRYDSSAAPWIDDLDTAITFFSELNRYCRAYLEKAESAAHPGRLEEINSRLAKIQKLKKKYQSTFDELLTKQQTLKEQFDSIGNRDADRLLLDKKRALCEKRCREAAEKLSRTRKKAGAPFDTAITAQMNQLGFTGGAWKTAFVTQAELLPEGLDTVAFEVKTNPGEPFLSLVKTASGGEISRLMLAIKTVLASHDRIPVLIFDEIDAGIGGHTAKEVARALQALSQSHQVLCISHLHQIAGLADHHYKVYKISEGERTVTRVTRLDRKEKIEEISRMLGDDSTIARKHAEELVRGKKRG